MTAAAGRARGLPATPRRLAIEALVDIDEGARANDIVPAKLAASRLEPRDRAFVTELAYGACRMRRACDWLVDRYVKGRTDPEVRAALRAGAYQLVWMRVPAHAAVSATVAEVRGPGRGLVNAVLRKVAKEVSARPPRWPDPATALSYPDWIVARLAEDLGPDDARAALAAMNEPAGMTVRADGYVQDRASQLVAIHVGAEPGDRVLDVCSAPGGKATALASNAAVVVAADISRQRLGVVRANADRLGLRNVQPVAADGRNPPWQHGTFDRVLVDAPCSGLGVLRRRPDARWRIRPGDIGRLSALQRQLINAAVPLLRPGGTLVYSVCTLTRDETAAIDRWAAGELPQMRPLPPPGPPWRPAGRGGLLLPQVAATDGMFVLSLQASR